MSSEGEGERERGLDGRNSYLCWIFFLLSEKLTVLTGSRHSLSRCWVCFALPYFSSHTDPPAAFRVTQDPKKPQVASQISLCDPLLQHLALGMAHICPGNSHVALPMCSSAGLQHVLALSILMPHTDIKLYFQTLAMQPALCYRS